MSTELLQRIAAAPQQRLVIWVVLFEDEYETKLGDGYYGYFRRAFLDERAAQAFARGSTADQHCYHVMITSLFLHEGSVTMTPVGGPHDSVDVAAVIQDLEALLRISEPARVSSLSSGRPWSE